MFAAMTPVAAWFATSSQLLSYFGLQIANAYYLITDQGFNFDSSLTIGRDRVVGISARSLHDVACLPQLYK
jgi:multidrug resistance protein MdtO